MSDRIQQPTTLICSFCSGYLFNTPYQAACGDRICGSCHSRLQARAKEAIRCPVCGVSIDLNTCFRDKAAEVELAKAILSCTNKGCSWQGEGRHFLAHLKQCRFAIVQCPNKDCGEQMYRSDLDLHFKNCRHKPIQCQWCHREIPRLNQHIHLANECDEVLVTCTNKGCNEKCKRKDLPTHLQTTCTFAVKDCEFKDNGCTFRGTVSQLAEHNTNEVAKHLKFFKGTCTQQTTRTVELVSRSADTKLDDYEKQISTLQHEIHTLRSELMSRVQSPVAQSMRKFESTIQQLQDGFGEMALLVQTLQATSYSGVFIWKIPEVARRRHEAESGRTLSLYSAPFYTSRHGYKLCLRLYMAGDGSGKGSHLSFFLTIMRGEFDSLLHWPFRQTVSLVLLDQDRQRDIVQSFRPEPSSASFQRPRLEMNVASGCPTFAPLSVLDNSSYVKDDTLFLKCAIDRTGLENT